MAIKIRQKKKQEPKKVHPQYQPNTGTHWAEQYREDNRSSFRKSFIAIIVAIIVIMVILIIASINAVLPETDNSQSISASDTFAVSQMEQDQMKQSAQTFAEGILVFAYCSDEEIALEGKTAALAQMANGTYSYQKIEDLQPVKRHIDSTNFAPVVTEPSISSATRSYAQAFSYEFDAVAADTSVVSEKNPNGTFADKGYHFVVEFGYAKDADTGENKWAITSCEITQK